MTEVDPMKKSCDAMGIPPGDYRLVGWDMDTTGKKVIDEICQIAAYTPSSTYSQYVMPYKDLNPTAIKRHSMKVVTNGKFRVLRNSKTNEVRIKVVINNILNTYRYILFHKRKREFVLKAQKSFEIILHELKNIKLISLHRTIKFSFNSN